MKTYKNIRIPNKTNDELIREIQLILVNNERIPISAAKKINENLLEIKKSLQK